MHMIANTTVRWLKHNNQAKTHHPPNASFDTHPLLITFPWVHLLSITHKKSFCKHYTITINSDNNKNNNSKRKSKVLDRNKTAKIGAANDNNIDDNAYDGDNSGDCDGKKLIMPTKHMTMATTTTVFIAVTLHTLSMMVITIKWQKTSASIHVCTISKIQNSIRHHIVGI